MSAEVAVVIPHYNDLARLRRCLEALTADPDAVRAEIVVADNGTEGGLEAVKRDFPQARFVIESRKGAGAARNRGAAETTAPRLFFLDSDCAPRRGWIAAGIAALETADIAGGAIEVFDETPPPRSGAQAFETVFAFRQRDYVEKKGFSVSANLLVWRRVFDDVGGFGVGMSEDVDWCRRATARGWRLVYAPDAVVAHPTRGDWPELVRKWRRLAREEWELRRTARMGRLYWTLRAGLVLASPLGHAARVLGHPRLTLAERLRGVATLGRIRAVRAGWMIRQALGRPV